MTGWMWLLVAIGIAVVGVGMFYGQLQSRLFERNPAAKDRQEKATRRLYRDEERGSD